ncbi:MAG: hypothetical protein JWO41_284 [Candidatus Saccharibacteria bacterium]|nr:hypothetical protein [Candidatus Saccharibacteria bacterium]
MSRKLDSRGFALPVIILLMALMAITAYTVLGAASNNLTLTYRQSYSQMARMASKAAIDYAQEQFDNAACGNYTGTAETDLVSNSKYRLTFKADVISTSADGLTKNIQGTGSVYLPKNSVSARYVFNIRSEIVNSFATCKTPDNYAPVVWLDASDYVTLKKVGSSTTTAVPTTTFGNVSDTTRDTLEERADNGTQTLASWQSNDFEMHICDAAEFSNSICTTNASKYLNIGLVYSNVSVPKNATITNATLTLACANPAGAGGSVTHKLYGFYKTSSNPSPDLFTQSGSNQLKTPLATANLHTVASSTVSENNCPPGNNTTYDVTSIVQEIINNSNWDPSVGRLGLAIQYVSGSGSRHLSKASNQLSISYSATTISQADAGDSVGLWIDKSGNGNNAAFTYGTSPTRVDNALNSKPIVRFNNGALLSSLTTALAGKREMTAFAVIKPNYSTSSTDGRVISGTSSGVNNDTTAGSSIIALLRNSSGNGISSIYSGTTAGVYRTSYACTTCSNVANIFASRFEIQDSAKVNSFLYTNGALVTEADNYQPSGSPYTYGIDQLYFGGTRTGAMPGSGTAYFNGDYAELIVYDHALTCSETQSIQEYLRSKWAISGTSYTNTCPADIPTL